MTGQCPKHHSVLVLPSLCDFSFSVFFASLSSAPECLNTERLWLLPSALLSYLSALLVELGQSGG